jgi:hypothetical protein
LVVAGFLAVTLVGGGSQQTTEKCAAAQEVHPD